MNAWALLLVAAASAAPEAPPAAASAFLSAIASNDLGAARAGLSPDVLIMDATTGNFVGTSLEAFAGYVRGCERAELTWDYDQEDPARSAVSVTWTCPARPNAVAFIWTDPSGVVHIQFGMPPV